MNFKPETIQEIQPSKSTPMMVQWHACKENAKDAILLFRLGDFYEAFYEDAHILSKEVELTLTQRQGIPMAGVPFHSCEGYIDKLVAKGYKIAIAEQMDDPKNCKGIVPRKIIRVITPGTLITSSLLDDKTNNYVAALTQIGSLYGLSFIDHTTADFRAIECENLQELLSELHRLRPSEFIVSDKFAEKNAKFLEELNRAFPFLLNTQQEWTFDHPLAYGTLTSHFNVQHLDSFGLKGMVAAINAAGALLTYLKDNLCLSISHIQSIRTYSTTDSLCLDRITQRNLELTESLRDGSKKHTLLDVLDQTCTPMGARLMRQWILRPLQTPSEILDRQDAIGAFLTDPLSLSRTIPLLQGIRDLERLMMRISTGYATPKDVMALKNSLIQIPSLKISLQELNSTVIQEDCSRLKDLSSLTSHIEKALVDDPPLRIQDGNIFREGYCPELDELRQISNNGKSWLTQYQAQLREQTGIKTLKVSFTSAFGYYIEVSHAQSDKMPPQFQRKQTLVNCERYISSELKEYEQKVLTAEERILRLETDLFSQLRAHIALSSQDVWEIARSIARLDCIHSLAEIARQWNYSKPIVDHSSQLFIKSGRHPVIEASLLGKSFTPNDTLLNASDQRLILLTGPNMGGKSTYIRQVALIAIMAHMGAYVPAEHAHIGIIDKVFTRIGASDDLSRGQSTFMVEMSETANILHNVTSKSLVILDEVGRGTSTYDGISLAWAISEYLLITEGKKAKTLFATHYWELTQLQERYPGAVNFNVAVKEIRDEILFLHQIVRGGTDKSYGIHVARLAGIPVPVIQRAKELLSHLEETSSRKNTFSEKIKSNIPVNQGKREEQLLLVEKPDPRIEQAKQIIQLIQTLDINQLTPLQALQKLAEIKSQVEK